MSLMEIPNSTAKTKPRIWTPEQNAIFDYEGNLIVEAGAGCGKSSTIEEKVKRMPRSEQNQTTIIAFNRHIKEEMAMRFDGSGVTVSTIHSTCLKAAQSTYSNWNFKYVDSANPPRKYLNILLTLFDQEKIDPQDGKERWRWVFECMDMISKCQLSLQYPDEEVILALQLHYGKISSMPLGQMSKLCWEAMRQGMDQASWRITFDDMVWLGGLGMLNLPKFKYVFGDEIQDWNPAQQSIAMQLIASGGTFVGVGDPFQSIYGFAGADVDGIETLKNTVEGGVHTLPLLMSRRCPKVSVRMANKIVPHLTTPDDAIEGIFQEFGDYHEVYDTIGWDGGDMWVCRTTAPLIEMALYLISQDIPACVVGKDIGKQLTDIVDDLERIAGFEFPHLALFLDNYMAKRIADLEERQASKLAIASIQDRCASLALVYRRASNFYGIDSVEKLNDYIGSLFSKDQKGGVVTLCTIHRSKGMESDRVGVLNPHLLPHPKATLPWELRQEGHLEYIALTRNKKALLFAYGDV